MTTRLFRVCFEGEGVIELDDAVIGAVDDEWRSVFYNLRDADDIAAHIAYNLVVRKVELSDLDGWANQPDERAFMLEDVDWDVIAREEGG